MNAGQIEVVMCEVDSDSDDEAVLHQRDAGMKMPDVDVDELQNAASRQHAQPKSAQFELAVWQFSDSDSDDEVVPQQRQVAPQECEVRTSDLARKKTPTNLDLIWLLFVREANLRRKPTQVAMNAGQIEVVTCEVDSDSDDEAVLHQRDAGTEMPDVDVDELQNAASRQHAQPKSAQFELAVCEISDSDSDDEAVPRQRVTLSDLEETDDDDVPSAKRSRSGNQR